MRVGLLGLSDKRHIVYSLIRVLGGLGRTIFLTSNKQYLQFSLDRAKEFEINDISVLIYDCDIDDLDEELELDSYDYVIYDCTDELPFKLDLALIMDSRDEYYSDLMDRELESIPLFTSCAVDKNDLFINERIVKLPLASLVEANLQKMFNERKLSPIKNGSFNKAIAVFLVAIVNLDRKLVIARLKKGELEV